MLKNYAIYENDIAVENFLVNDFLFNERDIIICRSYQNARTAKKSFDFEDPRALKVLKFGKIYVVCTKHRADWLLHDWKIYLYKQKGMFYK